VASLRDQIAEDLLARLGAIPGWTAVRRGWEQARNVSGVLAVVAILNETKQPTDQLFYACQLVLGVQIQVKPEDADPTADGGNVFRYLYRMVATAEAAVHSAPWPNEEQMTLTGHHIEEPENENLFLAELTLSVPYRHNWDDPTQFDPSYTP